MTIHHELERFSRDVANSASLRQELEAAGADLAGLVAFANERGYGFTVEDVMSQPATGELSDEVLAEVSGGAEPALASFRLGSFILVSKTNIQFTARP